MSSDEAQRVLQALRNCKLDGLLRDSLMLDFKRGSKFQKLEWAGDRHLKSLLASQAMLGVGRLQDEGGLSELCSRCESNGSLAKIFDQMELEKLVDEGNACVEQIDGAEKRKADIIEAVVGELKCHMDQGGAGSQARKAEDALKDLVTLIFLHGSRPPAANSSPKQQAPVCHGRKTADNVNVACAGHQSTLVVEKRAAEHLPSTEEKISKKAREAIAKLQWVKIRSGRLAARGRPSLEQLAALQKKEGVTSIVTLLRKDEGGCSDVERSCRDLELNWKHVPFDGLKDICIDNPPSDVLQILGTVDDVADWLKKGESVIVHCSAGLHRTGVYLYVLLRRMGYEQSDALLRIQDMRKETYQELTSRDLAKHAENLYIKFQEHQSKSSALAEASPSSQVDPAKKGCDANPVSKLHQYIQKNKFDLAFKEEGSQAEGFKCCAVVSGKPHKWSDFKATKKEAKVIAASLALEEIGIMSS